MDIVYKTEVSKVLEYGEVVVPPLSFLEEVKACNRFRPANGIIAVNYLRTIAVEVGRRYDKKFNAYRNVVPTDYVGIATHCDEDVARVVKAMFDASYPSIYKAYYAQKIKDAPFTAKCLSSSDPLFAEAAKEAGLQHSVFKKMAAEVGEEKPFNIELDAMAAAEALIASLEEQDTTAKSTLKKSKKSK